MKRNLFDLAERVSMAICCAIILVLAGAALRSVPAAGHGWLEEYLRAGIEPRLKKPFRPLRGA